ncbi:MAG: signal peptide peptidase SppA [Gammaproteobacteria bacterium]|nr:signal peptide peptidase SppA [Gammaproteobacteria bacterium]MDE0226533.1 signal peptide peptidase SppA [Gammaproteobacteria bacterium]
MMLGDILRRSYAVVSRTFAFLRAAFANVLIVLLLLVLVAVILSKPESVEVPDGTALVVAPSGAIVEQPSYPVFPSPIMAVGDETRAADIIDAIRKAASDERVALLTLELSDLDFASAAQLEAIGEAIEEFREAGKTVIATSDYFTQARYYLASFADEVYMHPYGELMLPGFGAYSDYYAGMLEKLKVNVHVYRVGEYKSAVEPYTRSDMSEDARKANRELVDDLWRSYVARVAENRRLDPQALQYYADQYDVLLRGVDGDAARIALESGMVDELLTRDAFRDRLKDRLGSDKELRTDVARYLSAARPRLPAVGPKVAVIVADGVILPGDQPRGVVGSESTTRLIRRAREDDNVKALVLRVDSPGGSAFASEVIRQELELVQAVGKPVVVSMGGVAASGGYWISATADEIWASPLTITGSIGVFAILPTFEDSLSTIGITRDGVGTTSLSGALDPVSGVSERMGNVLQSAVEHTYSRFVNLVARGRDMAPAEVEAIAQGHVWSGRKALDLGLVDELGHLEQAIEAAAERAGIEKYRVVTIEEPLSTQEKILMRLFDEIGLSLRPAAWFEPIVAGFESLASLNDPRHVYAICEFCGRGARW